VTRLALALLLCASAAVAQQHGNEAKHSGESGHQDSTTLWKWANFTILAGLLGYGISKAAGPFFAARTGQIQKSLVEARKLRQEAEARAAEIDRRMAGLASDIEALKAEAHREMAAESARVQAETERMLARTREQAEQEIEAAGQQAIAELKAHAAGLALDLARPKIDARMSPATQDRLVDQFVQRLGKPSGSAN
jgi:F-type H+-transporting ATPase subunit b